MLLLAVSAASFAAERGPETRRPPRTQERRVAGLLRQGARSFGIPATLRLDGAPERSIALRDLDGDGILDLVVADSAGRQAAIFSGDGNGHFASAPRDGSPLRQRTGARGDFDGDGAVDEAIIDQLASATVVQFGEARSAASGRLVLADFDQDGAADLALADGAADYVTVVYGDERGRIAATAEIAVGGTVADLAAADLNGDDATDLVVTDRDSDVVSVFLGTGRRRFGEAIRVSAGTRPATIAVGDVNGDDQADIVAADASATSVVLLRGDGTGGFGPPSAVPLARGPGDAWPGTVGAVEAYEGVAALALSPTTIAGGSGGSSIGTITLNAPAPAGGVVVSLSSSNLELAASLPSVRVPEGATNATFIVTTNSRYRPYSGLSFTVTISATHAATCTATLTVTSLPPPADFSSGSQANANTQWQGRMCGGIAPIGGLTEILYDCSPASSESSGFGTCTFRQECSLGCRRVPPSGGTFNDFCATTGPNAVAISRNYIVGGDRVGATIVAENPVTRSTTGVPGVISEQGRPGAVDGFNANSTYFPHGGLFFPSGASSMPFVVATSYVPTITFEDVKGFWFDDDAPPFLITNGRGGHAWLVMVPPDPAPALPIPTLGDFKITGLNPVTGGQGSIGQIDVSGISSGGGPTIRLTSSHPDIAQVPATFTLPAATVLGQQVPITTQSPSVETPVTITATDGRYTFTAVLTVRPAPPAPVLAGVSVSPASVVGGTPATGTVTLSAPEAAATVVALSTSLPNVAVLPASVTVPAGATGISFTIATNPVTSTFDVNIFADLAGSPGRQALLLVHPGATGPAPGTPSLVSPANNVTVSQPVSFDWNNAANAASYEIQVDDTSSFGAPLVASQTVTVSAATLGGLPAQRLWWRVRARNAAGTPGPFSSARRFTARPAAGGPAPALSAVALNPTTVNGGSVSIGTVTLTGMAPSGGAEVLLGTSNVTAAPVPFSVVVAPGQSAGSFFVSTRAVTATTTATISATFAGVTRTATLTIVPGAAPPPAVALVAFSVNLTAVTGGSTATGTVRLSAAAPSGGTPVALSSNLPGSASLPASVTVAAGQTTATFTVTTFNVPATTVQLSATLGDVTLFAPINVNAAGGGALPAPSLLSPANDARFSPGTTVTFDWRDVAGGTSYTIQIDDAESFSSPLVVETVTASQHSNNTLPTRRMWWRVRAVNATGTGAWSGARRFELKN
jgi:hypothetical protein